MKHILVMNLLSPFLVMTAFAMVMMTSRTFAADGLSVTEPPRDASRKVTVMHLIQPEDDSWNAPIPAPVIPEPPANAGLSNPSILRAASPIGFSSVKELSEAAGKPDGIVTGSGTAEDPFAFRNLAFLGLTKQPAIQIRLSPREVETTHILIENVRVEGEPLDRNTPALADAFHFIDTQNITIRHCEISKCHGIHGGGKYFKSMTLESCHIFSVGKGVSTMNSGNCIARNNYIHDSAQYGIMFRNGDDNVFENNYVAWSGNEGIGTNHTSRRQVFRNNVILNTGWTAINVEGVCDDSLVEGNLVVNSHYGIVFMGPRAICRANKVFYTTQNGIIVCPFKDTVQDGITVADNLVVAAADAGVSVMVGKIENVTISNNRIIQSANGVKIASPSVMISGNAISRVFSGITVNAVNDVSIADNTISHARYMISLTGDKSEGISIRGNKMRYGIGGIKAEDLIGGEFVDNNFNAVGMAVVGNRCANLHIARNQIVRSGYAGIQLNESTQGVVEGNRIANCRMRGIHLNGGGDHKVIRNTVTDNESMLGFGGMTLEKTVNNRIAENHWGRCAVAVMFRAVGNRGNTVENNSFEENGLELAVADELSPDEIASVNSLERVPVRREK